MRAFFCHSLVALLAFLLLGFAVKDIAMANTYIEGAQLVAGINQYERAIDIHPDIIYLEENLTPLVHLTWGKGGPDPRSANGARLPIKKSPAHNTEFNLFEKNPHDAWTAINYSTGYASGALTLQVDDASWIVKGMVLKAVGCDTLLVESVVNTTTIVVARSVGPTAATTLADNVPLYCIGDAYGEGSGVPQHKRVMTDKRLNYIQFFREPISLSWEMNAIKLYTGPKRADLRKEAWIEIKKKVERAFLLGEPDEFQNADGDYVRTTGGLHYWIKTVAGNYTGVSTTLTKAIWNGYLRNLFRYGSETKIVLCAPNIIDALDYWKDGNLQMKPDDRVYGLRVHEWVTGHGTALIMRDVMLEDSPAGAANTGFGGMAIGIDQEQLGYRYLDTLDFKLYEDRIKDGKTKWTDEIMGWCGLDLSTPKKGWVLDGVRAYT